jgi:hypothetical protein
MSKLTAALIATILADGVIDSEEAKKIHDIVFEDGTIDRPEMDGLFQLNDGAKATSPEFDALLAKAAVNHVLADEKTPNVLDDDESVYMISKIKGDGIVKTNEMLIVACIMANAKSVPDSFRAFAKEIGVIA